VEPVVSKAAQLLPEAVVDDVANRLAVTPVMEAMQLDVEAKAEPFVGDSWQGATGLRRFVGVASSGKAMAPS